MKPDPAPSQTTHREPKGGRGRGAQMATVPRVGIIRLPLMIAVITYVLCFVLLALGVREFVTRFVTAALIACLLAAIMELALGWRDEHKKSA